MNHPQHHNCCLWWISTNIITAGKHTHLHSKTFLYKLLITWTKTWLSLRKQSSVQQQPIWDSKAQSCRYWWCQTSVVLSQKYPVSLCLWVQSFRTNKLLRSEIEIDHGVYCCVVVHSALSDRKDLEPGREAKTSQSLCNWGTHVLRCVVRLSCDILHALLFYSFKTTGIS